MTGKQEDRQSKGSARGSGQGSEKGSGAANEGEGSRTAARHYEEATRDFVKKGGVDEKAREAARAVDGPEGDALKRAEREGKSHAHGEDPAVKR